MRTSAIAKPTTYRGIRYRSKSEAVCAVYLSFFELSFVIYEPSVPAFLFRPDFAMFSQSEGKVVVHLLEYKPAYPSDDFIETCRESYANWMHDESDALRNLATGGEKFWVLYGSPFGGGELSVLEFSFVGKPPNCETQANPRQITERCQELWRLASNYRFDLA